MNKALASSLAAAFGLSVAACAGTVDETTSDDAVEIQMDEHGNIKDEQSKEGEKDVNVARCKVRLNSLHLNECCW